MASNGLVPPALCVPHGAWDFQRSARANHSFHFPPGYAQSAGSARAAISQHSTAQPNTTLPGGKAWRPLGLAQGPAPHACGHDTMRMKHEPPALSKHTIPSVQLYSQHGWDVLKPHAPCSGTCRRSDASAGAGHPRRTGVFHPSPTRSGARGGGAAAAALGLGADPAVLRSATASLPPPGPAQDRVQHRRHKAAPDGPVTPLHARASQRGTQRSLQRHSRNWVQEVFGGRDCS